MSIDELGIHLGPLYIRYYGLIVMGAVVAGAALAEWHAKQRKLRSDFIWESLLWVVLAGVLGARLWHIFTPSPSLIAAGVTTQYYLTHPLDALAIWRGGLGIPGAVIGGVLALYILARRRGEAFAAWLDVFAPAIALGQGLGRWANYVNQELYGAPSDLSWAITIDPAYRLPEFADVARYHPIFLYESLWSLGTAALLIWLGRKFGQSLKPGDLFLVYLITYPTIRILLDFIRLDAAEIAGFNANQTFMAVVLVLAAGLLAWRHRTKV
ncbi:MAG: prolipoprotein diacylglyceryl transferase [Anaerolineales bacterium]|nr:prolipoprotein diacylglyceryl transferase [Anaerolineales bacterium]MCW5855975.1 prolipoprotein diacylglyceryl transferase [Anaerolineales bacterium]